MTACRYCQKDFGKKVKSVLIQVVWVLDTIRRAAHLPAETCLALESRAGHGQGAGGKESFEGAEAEKKAYQFCRTVLQRGMRAED